MSSLSIGQSTADLLIGKLAATPPEPAPSSKTDIPKQIFQEKGPSLDPTLAWEEAQKRQREDGQILIRLKRKRFIGPHIRLNSLLLKKEDLEKLYPKPTDKVLVRSPSNKKIFALAQAEFDVDEEGYEYGYIVPVQPEQHTELKKTIQEDQKIEKTDKPQPQEVKIESQPTAVELKSNSVEATETKMVKPKFSFTAFVNGVVSHIIKFLRDLGRRIVSCFRKSNKEAKKTLDFEKDSPLIFDKKAKFVRPKLLDPHGQIYKKIKSPLKSEPDAEGRVFIKATVDHHGCIRPLTETELKTSTAEEFLKEWEKVEFIPAAKDDIELNTEALKAFGNDGDVTPIIISTLD